MINPGLVLAVDTSSVVAVGLARGSEVLATAVVADPMAHVEQLTPLIHQVLTEAGVSVDDLTAVVFGLGPGPFTGLRVGIVTARVLARVAGLLGHGVCSLDALAVEHAASPLVGEHAASRPDGEFVAAIDARRREVYWARYAVDGTRVDGPSVGRPEDVPRLPTIGPAADLYPDRLRTTDGPRVLDPGVLAAHGLQLPDAGREPLYLRRPDAQEPTRRKSVLHLPFDRNRGSRS